MAGSNPFSKSTNWGWLNEPKPEPVKEVVVGLNYPETSPLVPENEIKQALNNLLVEELFKNKNIEYVSYKNPVDKNTFENTMTYKARFFIVDKDYGDSMEKVLIDRNVFITEDEAFSMKEVEEAIKKYYPERFV